MKSTVLGGLSFSGFLTKTELHRLQDFKFFHVLSRFFKVFPCFLRFSNVFQGVSGFLTLNSDDGPPRRPFHSLVLVKGGSYFPILKAK